MMIFASLILESLIKKGKILMPYLLTCSGICYLDGEEFELLKMCANFPCSQADNSFI